MALFISGFVLSLSLCLDLGIVNIAIIKTGIEKGFYQALNIGLGSSIGDMIYAILSLVGITLLFKYLIVKWILWFLGTGILLYFCWGMVVQVFKPLESKQDNTSGASAEKTLGRYLLSGITLALSSPTAIIWFASIGGSIIASQPLHSYQGVMHFFIGFSLASILWSFGLAYISYKGGQLMKDRIKHVFSAISAVIFLILAIMVFINGYRTLVLK